MASLPLSIIVDDQRTDYIVLSGPQQWTSTNEPEWFNGTSQSPTYALQNSGLFGTLQMKFYGTPSFVMFKIWIYLKELLTRNFCCIFRSYSSSVSGFTNPQRFDRRKHPLQYQLLRSKSTDLSTVVPVSTATRWPPFRISITHRRNEPRLCRCNSGGQYTLDQRAHNRR